MTGRLVVALSILAIALLGFFGFPGHTYLQSDTQIYVPMLEHIWNPATYPGDLVATKPHLSYTVYDEIAILARRVASFPFRDTLVAQQILFRVAQIFGVYLLALALPLSRFQSLTVAALSGLGASIAGPAVLLLEFEPVPRGFAVGLLFLAIGLCAHRRPILASAAASLAFLYHAPTTIPFWVCFLPLVLWRRQWRTLIPLAAAVILIAVTAHFQPGVVERQHFFLKNEPGLEALQRLRAPYNWVSNWALTYAPHYLLLGGSSFLAFRRIRPQSSRLFLIGLSAIGFLSVGSSFLLLEHLHWGLMSQVQPARALLFVVSTALILAAAAALRATRWHESLAWFALAFVIPQQGFTPDLDPRKLLTALALAVTATLWLRFFKPGLVLTLVASFFVIPIQHPTIRTPDLDALIQFARTQTPPNAMFLFPAAGKGLQPGIFRAESLRSVYVDWKAGGQVNYYKSLADDWWTRWRQCSALKYDPAIDYRALGIDYLVLPAGVPQSNLLPIYSNFTYRLIPLFPIR